VRAAHNRIRLDLNNPEFQEVLFRLENAELKQVVASLRRLQELEWAEFYRQVEKCLQLLNDGPRSVIWASALRGTDRSPDSET
jgi:hypothetical protein